MWEQFTVIYKGNIILDVIASASVSKPLEIISAYFSIKIEA